MNAYDIHSSHRSQEIFLQSCNFSRVIFIAFSIKSHEILAAVIQTLIKKFIFKLVVVVKIRPKEETKLPSFEIKHISAILFYL